MTDDRTPQGGKPPFPTRNNPPQPGTEKKVEKPVAERTLDDAIEDTFPASDPVSVDTRKPEGER